VVHTTNDIPSKTLDINIPELDMKKAPNRTQLLTAEESAIGNAPFAHHDPWDKLTEPNNP